MLAEAPEPQTAAEEPEAFALLGASWEGIKSVFGTSIADAVRSSQQGFPRQLMHGAESRYPRVRSGGDAIISLDLGLDGNSVLKLIHGLRSGAHIEEIAGIFGERIAEAVEGSDLRKWERRRGRLHTTDCVRVWHRVQFRICYDTDIAGILHSQDQVLSPIYSG